MKEKKPWYLEQANFFDALNPSQIQAVEKIATIERFEKGKMIGSVDDHCDFVYILKKGTIKAFLLSLDGKEIILALRRPGNIIGLTSIFGWSRRVSYVSAIDEVELMKIRTKDLKRLVLNNSDMIMSIIKILCARLHHSRRLIYDLSTKNVKYRLIRFLLDSADDIGMDCADGIWIKAKYTHEQISQIIVSSRQTVTSLLKELENANLIKKHQKQIIICDYHTLKEYLDSI